MKVIRDIGLHNDMAYPVGKNMANVFSKTRIFARLIDEHAPKNRTLNLLCRGSSGAIIAAIVATLLPERTTIINHVKKPGESAHDDLMSLNDEYYNIILDDFISTGRTISAIHKRFRECGGTKINMLIISGNVSTVQSISFLDELGILICGRVCDDFQKKYNIQND